MVLYGSMKESLSIPCSPPDNAQRGHVALSVGGLASQNGVAVFMLYDWWLHPGTGNKDLQGIARNTPLQPKAVLLGGTRLLTRSGRWQLEPTQRLHEETPCCGCWQLCERIPVLESHPELKSKRNVLASAQRVHDTESEGNNLEIILGR